MFIEPNADARVAGKLLGDLMRSLESEGFSRLEAMQIILTTLASESGGGK